METRGFLKKIKWKIILNLVLQCNLIFEALELETY